MVLPEALLSIDPGHVLSESCLNTIFLVGSLSVTPKKQHTGISVQLSKAILVLPTLTKVAFMAYVREEKSFSETTQVHGVVEEARSIWPIV